MKQNITRQDNWNLLNQFQNDLADWMQPGLLRSFGGLTSDNSKVSTGQWIPAVDIHEETSAFIITADLPGVAPQDIEVTMENGILTIQGHRQAQSKIEEKNYSRVERITGSFYRRFSLPDTANDAEINAEFKQGVLTVIIPKKEKAKARKINVKGGE